MKRIAVYAGSFDPPTNGHLWMLRQGAALFDELIIALAVNPDKKSFLAMEQRRELLRSMASELGSQVRVELLPQGFLVESARAWGATHLLRGIRNTVDLEYEKTIARMNSRMEPLLQSVFLIPPPELEPISSSLVRGFVGQPGWQRWVQPCVPPAVFELLVQQHPE